MNQSSIFTLEKTGNTYKNFDEFPQDLYVDTSAWFKMYSSNLSYNPIKEFMSDCLGNGTTLYHSEVVLSEIVHVNEKSFYDKYYDEYKSKVKYDGYVNTKKLRELVNKEHPEILIEINKSQNELINIVKRTSEMLEYEGNAKTIEEILKIREASGNVLGVNDAKHVYIARQYGINSFLTADGDFIALDNDNIYALQSEKYIKEKIGRNNVVLEFDPNKY